MKHRTTPFNRNFARLLDEKDITPKQIAEMTGIARDAIYRYRNGGDPPVVPRADTLLRLARVLGVTMDELYGGEEQ